jgi:hypothetical protein
MHPRLVLRCCGLLVLAACNRKSLADLPPPPPARPQDDCTALEEAHARELAALMARVDELEKQLREVRSPAPPS